MTTNQPISPTVPAAAPFSQSVLFEEFQEQPGLVAAAKRYLHTGKAASKDEELTEAIINAYASGLVSIRQIAKRLSIGRETVKVIIAHAEQAGKLGPLKQRLSGKMGSIVELSLDVLREKLEAGDVPANVLPIVVGVLSDKKAMLDGEATVRVETVGPVLTADQVRAEFDRMKRSVAVTVESESVVVRGNGAAAASLGATLKVPAPPVDGGRGGSGDGEGRKGASPSDPENISPKEGS